MNLLDDLFAADEVGAGFLRFLLLLAAGNGQHALGLAEAVRKDDGAAHHLIRVFGIDAEAHREFDRLVELRVFHFLNERDRLLDRVRPIAAICARAAREFLAVLCACSTSCGPSEPLDGPPTYLNRKWPIANSQMLRFTFAIRDSVYPTTSSPIDRAVPATVFTADSSVSS